MNLPVNVVSARNVQVGIENRNVAAPPPDRQARAGVSMLAVRRLLGHALPNGNRRGECGKRLEKRPPVDLVRVEKTHAALVSNREPAGKRRGALYDLSGPVLKIPDIGLTFRLAPRRARVSG